jgi:DNA-binding NarL/FixJ family response regulator
MAVRILLADDHEIVREGIKTLISRSRPEWEICGEASDGKQAIELVSSLQPDVIVLDVTMPGISGLEAASHIAKLRLASRILVFTMHESPRLANEVAQCGAHGLVLKSQATRDLVRSSVRIPLLNPQPKVHPVSSKRSKVRRPARLRNHPPSRQNWGRDALAERVSGRYLRADNRVNPVGGGQGFP